MNSNLLKNSFDFGSFDSEFGMVDFVRFGDFHSKLEAVNSEINLGVKSQEEDLNRTQNPFFGLAKSYSKGIKNASSLFCASLKDDLRLGLRRFAPEPVLAKIAVRDFFTLKPVLNGHLEISADEISNQNGVIKSINSTSATTLNILNALNNNSGKILSGGNILLDIKNDYTTSGVIAAAGDLEIKARNITSNIELEVGNDLSILATGSFTNNQNAKLTSGNNLEITGLGINNFGQIAANNNLTLNSKTYLINNANSLLFSNNNILMKVDDLVTNNNAEVWALNNITIQSSVAGSDSLFKTNKVENISGSIEAYLGNVNINAKTLINKREYLPVQGGEVYYRTAVYPTRYNPIIHRYYRVEMQGTAATEAVIRSGNNLTLNLNDLSNQNSLIYSKNNLTVNAANINNISNLFRNYVVGRSWNDSNSGGVGLDYCWAYGCDGGEGGYFFTGVKDGYINQAQTLDGKIIAKNNLVGNITAQINNSTITSNYSGTTNLNPDLTNQPIDITNTDLEQLTNSNSLNIAGNLTLPTGANNLFKVNDSTSNPSAKYLVETNIKFLDKAGFLGSDYFLKRLGFDPNVDIIQKRLGDGAFEQKLIMDSINRMTNFSYLEESIHSDQEQMQSLYDNALLVMDDLGLILGKPLTETQKKNLTKDIIWLVTKTINGEDVWVTEVYLANTTIAKLAVNKGSTIKAGNNLNLSAQNILSDIGSLTSGNDLTLISSNDIYLNNTDLNTGGKLTINAGNELAINAGFYSPDVGELNQFGLNHSPLVGESKKSSFGYSDSERGFGRKQILAVTDPTPKNDAVTARAGNSTFNAGTDINITAGTINIANNQSNAGGSIFITATGGDINNTNYQVTAGNNIIMNATNDVNNLGTKAGIDAGQETLIQAGNILSINAGHDITNRAATLEGTNLVYLTAANDINNEAIIDYKMNGSSATKDEAMNSNADHITSTLIAKGEIKSTSGNVVLVAGNDINNSASNITSNGQTYLEATSGDVNITTEELRNREVNHFGSRKKSITITSDNITNVSSNITSGQSLNIVGGNDVNIIGSKLDVTNDLNIDAGNDVNILNAINSTYFNSESKKKGSFTKTIITQTDYKETAVKSELNATNININSNLGDLLIVSSDLKSSNNTNLISDNGSILIGEAQLTEFHDYEKSREYHGIAKIGARVMSAGIAAGIGSINFGLITFEPIAKELNIDPRGVVKDSVADNKLYNTDKIIISDNTKTSVSASNITSQNDITLTATNQDVTISASNLRANNDLNVTSENLSILASYETNIQSFKESVKRTLSFRDFHQDNMEATVVDSNLNAGNQFNFNVSDEVIVSYKAAETEVTPESWTGFDHF